MTLFYVGNTNVKKTEQVLPSWSLLPGGKRQAATAHTYMSLWTGLWPPPFLSPKSYVEALTPCAMTFGGGACGR